jgi:glycosyltransferase involved in cell wall biosynthesis
VRLAEARAQEPRGGGRALAHLRDVPCQVVLPGRPNPYEDALRAQAAALGVQDRARFCGWVADEDLERLYREAAVVLLPSLAEGFGLPVLEAMVRGVPVACSDRSALREVAADAALTFDPHDQRAVAAAVRTLLTDPDRRSVLVARGHARAAQYTWERTARATVASYGRAIG